MPTAMKPGLQLGRQELIDKATRALAGLGIRYRVAPLSEIEELPDWADRKQGGSLIFIEAARWGEGMAGVGEALGRAPEGG